MKRDLRFMVLTVVRAEKTHRIHNILADAAFGRMLTQTLQADASVGFQAPTEHKHSTAQNPQNEVANVYSRGSLASL